MTAQVPDSFTFRGRSFDLVGVSGNGLFCPDEHGLQLQQAGTFCYRGFVAHYDVWDDIESDPLDDKLRTILRLKSLRVHPVGESSLPLLLFGAPLEKYERLSFEPGKVNVLGEDDNIADAVFCCRYRDCPEPVPYSGGVLLGTDFISGLAVHMGFSPAWKYREVHELVFENGVLLEEHDRSVQMARVREQQSGPRPKITDVDEYMQWIAKSFTLDYERGTF